MHLTGDVSDIEQTGTRQGCRQVKVDFRQVDDSVRGRIALHTLELYGPTGKSADEIIRNFVVKCKPPFVCEVCGEGVYVTGRACSCYFCGSQLNKAEVVDRLSMLQVLVQRATCNESILPPGSIELNDKEVKYIRNFPGFSLHWVS